MLKVNKSASRTVDILNLLAKSTKPLTQIEISEALALPKSSTYELIYTLLKKGVLEFDNEDLKTFKLSLKVFEIGMTILEKTDFYGISRPFLEDLSAKTGETVFLAIENNGMIVYVDREEKNSSITTVPGAGTRRPMYSTGLGKALLATYSDQRVKEIWEMTGKTTKYTKNTICNYNDLIKDLRQTRERGYAIDNREMEDEIFCVAAPIYGRAEKAVGVLSVASIYLKMDVKRVELFGKMTMETALAISKRIGFRKDSIYFGTQ
ncbi:IclR family transcriptional regulator [Sporomusa sp.]|uniref:IclR family transcriptional regulator n=1 Tax=Sporomusa sp. TaxID=2078658 RepID=UPI002C29BA9B|nr:IclR family transcriptional regulator [Sporomusa sp.]HWR45688.1 IclR family transcriptional regulator [Sporomusa sp.]